MKHARGEPPPAKVGEFKERLRIDFSYQCAYCEVTETYLKTLSAFGRDHFRPKSKFQELEFEYANLYYCCNGCNSRKGVAWPSEEELRLGFHFIDPCVEDPYKAHLSIQPDGGLVPRTAAGAYTRSAIFLDRLMCRTFRLRRLRVPSEGAVDLAARTSELAAPSLSERDQAIHSVVGEKNFRTLTNADIMRDQNLRKQLREDHDLKPGDDATKSCLDRIRRAKGYELSRAIAQKRSTKK